jgi:hypothetical protein
MCLISELYKNKINNNELFFQKDQNQIMTLFLKFILFADLAMVLFYFVLCFKLAPIWTVVTKGLFIKGLFMNVF